MVHYILIDSTAVGYIDSDRPNSFSILHPSGLLNSMYQFGQNYFVNQAKTIEGVNQEYTENFGNIVINSFKNK